MPNGAVVPVLAYADVPEAAEWLCRAFGFTERWRAGSHRAQLAVGGGSAIAIRVGRSPSDGDAGHSVMLRVEDVDAHHERARTHGAKIVEPPGDKPYGERQYTALDLGGHRWTFSETIADVAPEDWGASTSGSA
jgi:uncharacterized glyoxalase superfamily protein PhnB